MSPTTIPYDHRRPASEAIFVGRKALVHRMTEGLCSGHSYGLVGAPGMGKTSILFAIKRDLTYGSLKNTLPLPIPLYIEFNKHRHISTNALCEDILSTFMQILAEQYRLTITPSAQKTLLEEVRQRRFDYSLRTLSDMYYDQHHRRCRFVMLLDDIHRGIGKDILSEMFSLLRPLVSATDFALVSLVLSGEQPLEQEFRNDVSSLRALLSETTRVERLLPNDVAALVEFARDDGWFVEPGCEELAFSLTEGYPFKLHYYLFTALAQHKQINRLILQQMSENPYKHAYLNKILKLEQVPVESEKDTEVQKTMSQTINMLFLAANPLDTPRLRLDQEVEAIDNALRLAEYRRFDIKQHWAVRVSALQGYILRHQPTIVHFSGHGSSSNEIILEDDNGKKKPVSPQALSQLFAILKDNIRCVVLNACYSKAQAEAIAQHIECVIGMSDSIRDDAAISFATSFYQALGYGRDMKTAFELGKSQIALMQTLKEQDIPKLLALKSDPQKIILVKA